MKKYRLKRDYITPSGTCYCDTTKSVEDWQIRWFQYLTERDFEVKKDWFEEVEDVHPVFGELDKWEWVNKVFEPVFMRGTVSESTVQQLTKTEAFHIANEYAKDINGGWECGDSPTHCCIYSNP